MNSFDPCWWQQTTLVSCLIDRKPPVVIPLAKLLLLLYIYATPAVKIPVEDRVESDMNTDIDDH